MDGAHPPLCRFRSTHPAVSATAISYSIRCPQSKAPVDALDARPPFLAHRCVTPAPDPQRLPDQNHFTNNISHTLYTQLCHTLLQLGRNSSSTYLAVHPGATHPPPPCTVTIARTLLFASQPTPPTSSAHLHSILQCYRHYTRLPRPASSTSHHRLYSYLHCQLFPSQPR